MGESSIKLVRRAHTKQEGSPSCLVCGLAAIHGLLASLLKQEDHAREHDTNVTLSLALATTKA